MSEEELKKLKEFVLRDIRIIDKTKRTYQIKTKEAIALFDQYKNKVKIYRCVKGEIFATDPDAERWEIAFDSYLKYYKCFLGNGYQKKNDLLWYENVKITADLLTGANEIIQIAETLINGNETDEGKKKELKSALELFCSVAYTVGNCCPVMKNPKAEGDFCWLKLANYHNTEERKSLPGIKKMHWDNDLRKRGAQNMFAVFPDNPSGRVIVNRLMLNDYYKDSEYNLTISATLDECKKMNADDYIKFMLDVTRIIVKRGIRIYCKNKLRDIHLNERGLDKFAKKLIEERKAELGIQ